MTGDREITVTALPWIGQKLFMTDVTVLLNRWQQGDSSARDEVVNAIYSELTKIAGALLKNPPASALLQPNALVHEAYIKLVKATEVSWQSRTHFLAVASTAMRHILVDHTRNQLAQKRDGGVQVALTEHNAISPEETTDVLMLHEALEELNQIDPIRARLVELRYFGGCTLDEVAEELDISRSSVQRHWQVARAWLFRRLQNQIN